MGLSGEIEIVRKNCVPSPGMPCHNLLHAHRICLKDVKKLVLLSLMKKFILTILTCSTRCKSQQGSLLADNGRFSLAIVKLG